MAIYIYEIGFHKYMRHKSCFFQQLVSERSSILNLYNMFVSFGINDNSFMMMEDYAISFVHSDWNYCLIKTDTNVMMLFKFDVKYVKLNFKAIASMEFSFDIKFCLLCSYDGCLFMKNYWKLLQKKFWKIWVSHVLIHRKLLLIDHVKQ